MYLNPRFMQLDELSAASKDLVFWKIEDLYKR